MYIMQKSITDFTRKTFLVTGGSGYLGSCVVQELVQRGVPKKNIRIPRSKSCDLRLVKNCEKAVKGIDIVIHLAAKVGGIGFNLAKPGELFFDNLIMGALLMESARRANVEKFVAIGTICAYPKFTPVPFKEKDLWNGYPEETNAPYGLAKKMLLVQAQSYRAQYGLNAIFLLPVNLYGAGDNSEAERHHVILALVEKFSSAVAEGKSSVTLWGSGQATREFIHVKDAARAIVDATSLYNKNEPVNIGSGMEISIKDLAKKIAGITGYTGQILWDRTKPDGQPRRRLDISRARNEFDFKARVDFDEGLRDMVQWYRKNKI